MAKKKPDSTAKKARAGKGGFAENFSSKSTLNLCKRDRAVLSPELFFLCVAIILLIILFVEFFGIYRPYRAVEEAEAQLAADRARLQATLGGISDYDEIQRQYREYNYENYDKTIADRPEILALLEETVFRAGKVTTMSLDGNELQLTITDVPLENVGKMQADLLAHTEIVSTVKLSYTGYQQNVVPIAYLTIGFHQTEAD